MPDDQIMMFYSVKNKSTHTLKLDVYTPDLDTVKTGKSVIVSHLKEPAFHISKNNDSALSALAIDQKSNEQEQTFQYAIIGKNGKLKNSLSFDLPEGNYRLSAVESSGFHAGVIAKEQDKDKTELFRLNANTKQLSRYSLSNDSLITRKALLAVDRMNQQFLLNGLYEEKTKTYKGLTFFATPGGEGDPFKHYEPFPRELIESVYGKKTMKEGLENFQMQKLIPRSDGGTMLFLEEYTEDREIYHDDGYFGSIQKTIRNYHYYEEVVIAAVSPKGEIQWYKVHHKNQRSVNDEGRYSSYNLCIQKDRIILFYNSISHNTMNLLYYTLSPDGELKGDILVKGKRPEVKAIPKSARQVSHDEVLMPAIKEERLHFLKVDFR